MNPAQCRVFADPDLGVLVCVFCQHTHKHTQTQALDRKEQQREEVVSWEGVKKCAVKNKDSGTCSIV